MGERVLVVDDDSKILAMMRRGLIFAGYEVDLAETGEQALDKTLGELPDLVIIDVMLPGIDGLEVCRRLRAAEPRLPILLLTARDRVPDRVAGLDAGADDYLVKPFAFDELLARIRALLRRAGDEHQDALVFADLRLNSTTHEVLRGERSIDLTLTEYQLLEYFMRHPRQVLSRDRIHDAVWGDSFFPESNVIDVHIKRLREKLESDSESRLIQTIRGVGYSLRQPSD
ncbi:MAG TPA: response regulator transcription factor [Thermomicrobiales bacterium]|jgi:two-component system response regulator MprA|nr:DNA-binding response regulator [Chloroflexota bacterium]HBY45047.1 DNA-binding response regulator [Chloroflexota bacterium]HCG28275.1 DNA-binding response regulator [Chloroflexota bacterium]HQZ91259.1 response regulator transcription factor [Thermomicrobiales bacterium]HRA32045.1 response regulator transcription factor [Thermomicrobiales bacterium]